MSFGQRFTCRTTDEQKKELVQETADFILQNYADANLNLSGTAQHFQVSEGYLSSIFKEYAGICFAEYLENAVLKKLCFAVGHCLDN